MPLTRLLWIGPATHFPRELADDPRLDVVWDDRCPERSPGCDLVVLDAESPGADGWLASRKPGGPPVAVWSAAACGDEWRARGARAVLPGDAPHAALGDALLRVARSSVARRDEGACPPRSQAMRAVMTLAERAARSRATVLVQGETGTGKEVVARAIHAAGPRARQPFVAINCAALPDALLESELFGHARGAFTGAERERRGAFEEADGGTLFLDEVGETSAAFQAKLLRVLQDRAVRPLGSARSRRVDVRVVAATHRALRREVARGRFREDLFFRLHVFPIRLPPLRERPEDVLSLAEHFLARHGRAEGKEGCSLTPEAARRLGQHDWPGNVRELENEIQRALVLAAPGAALGAEVFVVPEAGEPAAGEGAGSGASLAESADAPLRESLARAEARLIRAALARHGGRRSETARRLGITREGLYKKMKRFGIE